MDTKAIRKAIKEQLGYNARQVSVKKPHYSSIVFTIRDIAVNFDKVTEFVKRYESIDRDSVTFEILSGGNTFVTVSIDDKVKDQAIEKYGVPVSALLKKVNADCNDQQGIGDDTSFSERISVFIDNQWTQSLYIDGSREGGGFNPDNALRYISVSLWERGITIK